MKAYMGYSRAASPAEGACLVFAINSKSARKLAYGCMGDWFDGEWIDTATRLLRDLPEHLKALDNGTEHAVESPPVCPNCEMWGGHKVGAEGRCTLCESEDG